MNKVPDRAKMRRDYLWKKGDAYASVSIGGCISFVAIVFIVLLIWYIPAAQALNSCDCGPDYRPPSIWEGYLGISPLFVVSFILVSIGVIVSYKAMKNADAIPYVPSADELIATLPADEILLRGSQAEPASTEELLRPGRDGGANAEELLRATVRREQ